MTYWGTAVWMICLNVVSAEKLPGIYLKNTRDVYCNGSMLLETTTHSELVCAGKCRSDAKCVAYSRRASQCVLHDGFCSSSDLLPEAGARYMEIKWECLGFSCYWMRTTKMKSTKAEADAICEAMEAHVLATETKEEADFVSDLAYRSAAVYAPVDGSISAKRLWLHMTSSFTWGHSGEPVTYTSWAGNQPDQSKGLCVATNKNGSWRNLGCHFVYAFICERSHRAQADD